MSKTAFTMTDSLREIVQPLEMHLVRSIREHAHNF